MDYLENLIKRDTHREAVRPPSVGVAQLLIECFTFTFNLFLTYFILDGKCGWKVSVSFEWIPTHWFQNHFIGKTK